MSVCMQTVVPYQLTDIYSRHCKQKLMFCEYIWNFQNAIAPNKCPPPPLNGNNFNNACAIIKVDTVHQLNSCTI